VARNLQPILELWTQPVPTDDAAAARAFTKLYTDPVRVNGSPISARDMVERARAQQRAFSDLKIEPLQQVDTPEHTAIAFRQTGRHTGPLPTALGEVAPTGRAISRQVIDVLSFGSDGRVHDIYVVGDELGLLVALGAVALKS
jgi:hypothetical protein